MIGISEKARRAGKSKYAKEIVFANHGRVSDGQELEIPLPSKTYLALYAACCKVAAMSGAAEYLDKVDREYEETDALADDGRSADVLVAAVWRAAASHGGK